MSLNEAKVTKAAAEAKQQEQLVEIERLERDKTQLEHALARVTADYSSNG